MIEVFTVGGGEYLVNVFNAVASWAGSGGYRGLIRVVMVMAFTWALLVTAWNMDPRALLKWFMQATLMYMVVMVPTISVKVTDRTNPGVTAAVVDKIFAPEHGSEDAVRLLLAGTNFQIKVWEALLRIPPGSACTYEDVAQWVGQPSAARAVGGAMHANRTPIVVPCHRVVGADGALTGFGGGLTLKQELLELEKNYKG